MSVHSLINKKMPMPKPIGCILFFIDEVLELVFLSKNKRSELDSVIVNGFCEKSRLHLFQTLLLIEVCFLQHLLTFKNLFFSKRTPFSVVFTVMISLWASCSKTKVVMVGCGECTLFFFGHSQQRAGVVAIT